MNKKTVETVLTGYDKVEERIFLSDIKDCAETERKKMVPVFTEILSSRDVSLHLKYLVIKAIGVLGFPELTPLLGIMRRRGEKIRIVIEAVNSLVKSGTVEAYKLIVSFMKEPHNSEHRELIENHLKEMISETPLIYYYDIFFRRNYRTSEEIFKGISLLGENLEDGEIGELLGILETNDRNLCRGLLMLIEMKPSSIFYANIYRYFRKRFKSAGEEEFRIICKSMIRCALLFGSRDKIFDSLETHLKELKGIKRDSFSIFLLNFGKDSTVEKVSEIYSQLSQKNKAAVFLSLQKNFRSRDFARQQILLDPEPEVLDSIVKFLGDAEDTAFLCSFVKGMDEEIKVKILDSILSIEDRDVSDEVAYFVVPGESSESSRMVIKYLLTKRPEDFYEKIKDVWNSEVSDSIRSTIIRNTFSFYSDKREAMMHLFFESPLNSSLLRKDLLITAASMINSGEHDSEAVQEIVNKILVLMEQASEEEIVNYIYFFDRTELDLPELWELIKDELRMVQNTLILAHGDDQLVRMIHYLIKKIDKDLLLKR